MRIKIETDIPVSEELFRVAEILTKLRYRTDYWKNNYGSLNRQNKEYWENKADEWIKEHVKEQM